VTAGTFFGQALELSPYYDFSKLECGDPWRGASLVGDTERPVSGHS
jgi:hypothetical protein